MPGGVEVNTGNAAGDPAAMDEFQKVGLNQVNEIKSDE
jgi:hypothetical protein